MVVSADVCEELRPLVAPLSIPRMVVD